MLKIAICDDNAQQLDDLMNNINNYLENNHMDADIYTFTKAEELFNKVELMQFHIYFLDIIMPVYNGLELGKKIRRLDWNAQIVYVSTAVEYALESFTVQPFNYIIKPVQQKQIFETLANVIKKVDLEDRTFAVKDNHGLQIIPLTDITYCEYMNHKIRIILSNREPLTSQTFRCSFTEFIAPLLEDGRFLQPHSSYLLNMSKVSSIEKNEFIMKDGSHIPIAKSQYANVRSKFFAYMFSKEKNI